MLLSRPKIRMLPLPARSWITGPDVRERPEIAASRSRSKGASVSHAKKHGPTKYGARYRGGRGPEMGNGPCGPSVVQYPRHHSGSSGKELRVHVFAFARSRSFMVGVTTGIVFERARRTTTFRCFAASAGFFSLSVLRSYQLLSVAGSLAAFPSTGCRHPDRTPSGAGSRFPATRPHRSRSRPGR